MSGLSAVIPIDNTDPSELIAALDSLERAKLVETVILVIDRASDQDTADLLRHLSLLPTVRVIWSGRKRGTSHARAYGIHHATTPYILNMDSDDLVYNDGVRLSDLAPINLARQNSPWSVTTNIWDFIDSPGAIQWGSIISTDLARSLSSEHSGSSLEDIAFGFRLLTVAWRDRIPVTKSCGVRYWWRAPEGRDRGEQTETLRTNRGQTRSERERLLLTHLKHAIAHAGLCDQDARQIIDWRERKGGTPLVLQESSGARIDTHVLSYSGGRENLAQAVSSLRGEPTNIHLVMGGFDGSIGQARAFAFTLGDAEYVSFLDDDDYAIPGAMQQCVDYLDANPDCVGAYTNRYHLHANGRKDPEYLRPWHWRRMYHNISEVTHLKVMRRSAVTPYLDELKKWPTWEEYVLCGLMTAHGRWHHLPIFGAVKRYKDPSVSSVRLSSGHLMQQARKRVLPVMLMGKS